MAELEQWQLHHSVCQLAAVDPDDTVYMVGPLAREPRHLLQSCPELCMLAMLENRYVTLSLKMALACLRG